MEDLIQEMLEKGLISIAKQSVLQADRLYHQLQILSYTTIQTEPDTYLSWLRQYRGN